MLRQADDWLNHFRFRIRKGFVIKWKNTELFLSASHHRKNYLELVLLSKCLLYHISGTVASASPECVPEHLSKPALFARYSTGTYITTLTGTWVVSIDRPLITEQYFRRFVISLISLNISILFRYSGSSIPSFTDSYRKQPFPHRFHFVRPASHPLFKLLRLWDLCMDNNVFGLLNRSQVHIYHFLSFLNLLLRSLRIWSSRNKFWRNACINWRQYLLPINFIHKICS